MKSAVAYARVSSKKQEDTGFSIPAQIELFKQYSEKSGIKIVKFFVENKTGGKVGRKVYNEMLAFIKQHNIKDVFVEKTDRIYRNFKDYVVLEDLSQNFNLVVHLVKERVILSKDSTSHEKLVHGFKVLLAKNYLDNLREEVLKGREEKIREGGYPHKAPVGYYNDTDKSTKKKEIFVDKEKSVFVKRLFDLYSTGAYSVDELRTKLFNEGFNHKGKPYSKPRLLFVLKDVFYIGKMKIKGIVYDGKHTPIIDIETFNRVQKMFNQSKARSHDVEFAYTGLLTCGHCGCQMTAELKKGKYVYYHCTGKRGGNCKQDYIREEKLDEIFLQLIDRLPNPEDGLFEEIKKAVKEIRQIKSEYEETSMEEIQKQINRLQNRLDNLYTDKLDGRISQEYWQEKHNEWYNEKDRLIEKLKVISNTSRTFDEGSNLLENFCKYARQEFLKANGKKKRAILKMLGSNFSYKDKEVSIVLTSVFNYLLNNRFVKYGARELPTLELHKIIFTLKDLFSQEFISQMKLLDVA